MEEHNSVFYDSKAQRMADQMVMAEARHIARRKAEEDQCECKEGMFPRAQVTDRRKFLFAAGSTLAGVVSAPALAQTADQKAPPGAFHFGVPDDPTKEQGRAVAADGG
jgi:sulfane dehydrogenase subunit SoxC